MWGEMAGPIVDLVLLRGLFSDTALKPGTVFAARVLDREGPRGTLLLNGVRVPAQLPPDLVEGDAMRLRVAEATAERIVLQVVQQGAPSAPAGQTPPAALALALPGGAHVRVMEEESGPAGGGGEPGRRSITLRYDSPALGRLDFVLDLEAQSVSGTVHAPAGDPAARARAAAGELRDGLTAATGRPATVAVREREETLDVRA
jgi:hypothetical protein